MAGEPVELLEYYVETRQVVYRDCRVLARSEAEAKSLVREGKAGLVEVRPVETHKGHQCMADRGRPSQTLLPHLIGMNKW